MSWTPRISLSPEEKPQRLIPPLPSPRLVFPSHSDMYHKTPVELEDWNYEENMKMSFVH